MNKTDIKRPAQIVNGKEKLKEKSEDNDKLDKKTKAEIGLKVGEMGSNFLGNLASKIIDYFTKKDEYKYKESSNREKELQESNEYLKKKIEEFTEYIKNISDKKGKDNQIIIEANKEWNEAKNKIIESMFTNLDLSQIEKKSIKVEIQTLENELIVELDKILDDNLMNNSLIQEKHDLIYKEIKGDIKQVKSYNFMLIGFTGVGKSCLTNAILNKIVAEEGNSINPQTDKITQFENESEPGITIYDTIGIESTNIERGLSQIKEKVEKTFVENLDNPEKSLHGILYCINNGTSANKIEKGEIEFILELNRLYGENDILIIVFTQSLNSNTEEKKRQLREALKNDKIEIYEVMAKDYVIKTKFFEKTVPASGIKELKEAMIKKSENKLVKCNLKQIIKKKIKDKFEKIIEEDYDKLEEKIKSKEFEKTLNEESNLITKKLVGKLDINFEKLDEVISKFISKEKMDDIKKELLKENKSDFFNELYEVFNEVNEKYGNMLTNFSDKEITKKFDEYFKKNILKYITNIYFEKASLIIIKKCKDFFADIVSKNVTDEDVDDLIKSNLNNVLKKN
jgi:carbon monoxide dehydrogenase subunit G